MTKIDIISGFLGAGKTTFIKKMLEEVFSGEKVVLVENEYGEVGIDGGFLKDSGIEIKELNSGCICCSLVGDFNRSLNEVIETYHPDRILIEPSDRKHADLAQLRREQVQHRSAPPILGRAQHACGLMQHDVGVPSEHQLLPVDRDAAALRVILLLRAAGDPSVHQHATLAHERLDLAARPASRREWVWR